MPLSKHHGLARGWPMAPGLGLTPSKGGGVSLYAFTYNGIAFTFGEVAFTYGAPA